MRQETVTIYTFEELTEEAKDCAIEKFRDNWDFHWCQEWRDSLETFTRHFPVKARDWSVGAYSRSYIRSEFTGDYPDMCGARLFKYLYSNFDYLLAKDCPFTGYCGDEELLAPLREFMKRPSKHMTFEALMSACLEAWAVGYQHDMEGQLEDDYIADFIAANGYEFTENGERY